MLAAKLKQRTDLYPMLVGPFVEVPRFSLNRVRRFLGGAGGAVVERLLLRRARVPRHGSSSSVFDLGSGLSWRGFRVWQGG